MFSKITIIVQIILSILLVIVILLQQKGSGLGAAFGGGGNIYSTKRGMDKVLYYATIVIAVLFFLSAIISLLV